MRGLPLLFAFGVDDCGFSESHGRDEIADAHALLLCCFDDFLGLFWGVVREDGPSPHDAHPAAHDGLFLVHVQILAKCIPGEGLSRLREHWKATRSSCRRSRAGVSRPICAIFQRRVARLWHFSITAVPFCLEPSEARTPAVRRLPSMARHCRVYDGTGAGCRGLGALTGVLFRVGAACIIAV
jgi:hypothetical protein